MAMGFFREERTSGQLDLTDRQTSFSWCTDVRTTTSSAVDGQGRYMALAATPNFLALSSFHDNATLLPALISTQTGVGYSTMLRNAVSTNAKCFALSARIVKLQRRR